MNDLTAEAHALIDAARSKGLNARLIGGLAVRELCPSARNALFERRCGDIDLVTTAKSAEVESALIEAGCTPNREFNLYNGHARMLFVSPGGHKLDVFVGTFKMCHSIQFAAYLPEVGYAVFPAELLLTKLQIHETNDKDFNDAAAILYDHPPTDDDSGVNATRVARLCGVDWGLYRTVTTNLQALENWCLTTLHASGAEGRVAAERVGSAATILQERIEAEPKSARWKARALIGPALRWYELPEEVE